MTSGLYSVAKGALPLASDVNQVVTGLQGTRDLGQVIPFAVLANPTGIPTSAANGSGNLTGTYGWVATECTGGVDDAGNVYITGETLPSPVSAALVLSSNQATVGNLPTGTTGVVAVRAYRNKATGSATTGPFYLVQQINNNTTVSIPDNTPDGSLGALAPVQNTTGTSIAGINALTHGGALMALLNFAGNINTSRGVRGQFSRASVANNPYSLVSLPNDAPCYVPGKWGGSSQALSVWEGTTNLVYNSDFETVTTTATLFSDPLTSGTAWTVQSGSFTYSASGATSTAGSNGSGTSTLAAGNPVWAPLLGSDGSTSLPLTAQATFVEGSTVGDMLVHLWKDINNRYVGFYELGNFHLYKVVSGTATQLASVAYTAAASTTYTITLELDHLGNLTAKLYSGSGTGGTLLETLTATDTSLSGGFLVGVGGDTGVIVSNASVTGPWANGWTIGGSGSVAWALTSAAISGKYSASAVGMGAAGYATSNSVATTASAVYAFSGYATTTNATAAYINANPSGGSQVVDQLNATSTGTRYTSSFTSTTTGNSTVQIQMNGTGTAVFDALQVESKAYATPYLRNDSTSATATRAVEQLTIPTTGMSESAGAIVGWFQFNVSVFNQANAFPFRALADSNGGYGLLADGTTLAFNAANDAIAYTMPASFVPGMWLHLAVAWNGSTVYGYVNGALVGTTTQGTAAIGSSWDIGHLNGGQQVDGAISNLAFLNACPTPAEMYSLYAATEPLIDALATPIAPGVSSLNSYATNPDSNDVYTTITYKRRDNTTESIAVFSNPVSGTSYYQTLVVTYYMADGVTTQATETWSIAYDVNGKVTSKVLQ
ncbi:MAG: LamG-like jellyroll fold domain-containing protein [Bacilli bacterium]